MDELTPKQARDVEAMETFYNIETIFYSRGRKMNPEDFSRTYGSWNFPYPKRAYREKLYRGDFKPEVFVNEIGTPGGNHLFLFKFSPGSLDYPIVTIASLRGKNGDVFGSDNLGPEQHKVWNYWPDGDWEVELKRIAKLIRGR